MIKQILYPIALDEHNNLIHVDNAQKGTKYYCPECRNEFILNKSGKTGKYSKRTHFSHNKIDINCNPDLYVHNTFIKLLVEFLQKRLLESKQFQMNWECSICNKSNSVNLLRNVQSIKTEFKVDRFRSDIAFLNEKNNIFAVIEVVFTHKPEVDTLSFYKNNKIVLIQLNIASFEDLYRVEQKIKNPDIVDLCINHDCSIYQRYKLERKLHYFERICNNCFRPIKSCNIELSHPLDNHILNDFNKNEIELAKSKGVQFGTNIKRAYPFVICLNCKRMKSRFNKSRF